MSARRGKSVCIATSGTGATNLITRLGDALMDSIPIVAITGQVASLLIGTDAFQEADVLGLSLACTKHSFIVQHIDELSEIPANAFGIAQSGRPGPVLVDVPEDVQIAPTTAKPRINPPPKATALHEEHLTQTLTLLREAQRPVIYIGGVSMAGTVPALRYFLHSTQMPSRSDLKRLGCRLRRRFLLFGHARNARTKAANYITQEADLLLVFGTRFDDRVTGKLDTFAPHVKVIHVDIDGAELGKLSERLHNNIWIKREDRQPVNSFKLRGAYAMISSLLRSKKRRA
ncbi:acetolactate synthase II, large subunit,putative' [Aggregatibacter actinomycetemcomitans HK1651]|nr:acetolactate synthase II, large subunit,putative' [Aggregatibacter actinomycetemcomitans HK1651]